MTKISKPRAPRTNKNKAAAAAAPEALTLQHAESVSFSDEGDAALNSLIASLDMPEDEVVVDAANEGPVSDIDDEVLDAAVSGAEAIDVMVASATPDVIDAAGAPTGTESDVDTTVPAEAGKVKKTKAPKAAKEKKVATPRKTYTGPAARTDRLKDKLGSSLVDYSVLTLADAGVDEAELGAVMEATMVLIREMNKKAQNWAVKFIEYLAGRKTQLSEVTGIILKVLERDGAITTGNEGNVFKALVARPYSPGSARAMGGNNIAMLTDLKVITADGKGRFVANADSLLLMKVRSMMAAPVVAAAPEASVTDDSVDEGETDTSVATEAAEG